MVSMLKSNRHTRKDIFRFTVSGSLLPISLEPIKNPTTSSRSRYSSVARGVEMKKKTVKADKEFNIDIVFENYKFKEVKTTIPSTRGGRGLWKVYAAIEKEILKIEEKMKDVEFDLEMEEIKEEKRKSEVVNKLGSLAIKRGDNADNQ